MRATRSSGVPLHPPADKPRTPRRPAAKAKGAAGGAGAASAEEGHSESEGEAVSGSVAETNFGNVARKVEAGYISRDEVKIPSYHDAVAREHPGAEAEFMEALETWPSTRAHLLQLVQRKMEPILISTDRRIETLDQIFYNIRRLGTAAKSEFGTLFIGCLREVENEAVRCFRVQSSNDDGTLFQHDVKLIVKLLPPVPASDVMLVPYVGIHHEPINKRTKKITAKTPMELIWIGSYNPLREIIIGRFLNRLVQQNITPHFPVIYESFTVSCPNSKQGDLPCGEEELKEGFAMEMCHFDFFDYIFKHLILVKDKVTRDTMLRIALIQITQGLCAAAHHFDFRHNDLHCGNAMVTFITNGAYAYKFSVTGRDGRKAAQYYEVPNAGMCWKMIDFGNTSSDVFGKHDNAASVTHSRAYDFASEDDAKFFLPEDHAIEMFDIMRLLGHADNQANDVLIGRRKEDGSSMQEGWAKAALEVLSDLQKELKQYIAIARDIARASPKSGSLAETQRWDLDVRGNPFRVYYQVDSTPYTDEKFLELVKNSRLMEDFFHQIAAEYVVDSTLEGGVVFDTHADLFKEEGHHTLNGIEAKHFYVENRTLRRRADGSAVSLPSDNH